MRRINTELWSSRLRERLVLPAERKVLIARLAGSDQEKDLAKPVNCNGYGRIHHFRFQPDAQWSANPLPNVPVARAFGREPESTLRVQIFQNAACNWRCWYCFVDFPLLSANTNRASYFSTDELIEMYLQEDDKPYVIDLSGGQPDLSPEWILWMMQSIEKKDLTRQIFLWSDDNLSNDYFWVYLTPEQRRYMAAYPMYSRVACFKGYDEKSFAFNTFASPELFERQFEIFKRLLLEGMDIYAYVTFTAQAHKHLDIVMNQFVDRLQTIHPNLPLRTVPLKITAFTPTKSRMDEQHRDAIRFQFEAHDAWRAELERRFSKAQRTREICDIPLT